MNAFHAWSDALRRFDVERSSDRSGNLFERSSIVLDRMWVKHIKFPQNEQDLLFLIFLGSSHQVIILTSFFALALHWFFLDSHKSFLCTIITGSGFFRRSQTTNNKFSLWVTYAVRNPQRNDLSLYPNIQSPGPRALRSKFCMLSFSKLPYAAV